MTDPVSWTVLVGLVCMAGLFVFLVADGPVDRLRVARFAIREQLTLTRENCPQVIAYLAVTRRWRGAGVCAALTWYVVVGLQHHTIGVNIAYVASGWFAGALVAELRVRHLTEKGHAASLVPRTLGAYLPAVNQGLFIAAAVTCLALTGLIAMTPGGLPLSTALPGVATVGLTAAVLFVGRRILLRPQPAAPVEVLAADDAIRRRSLRTLTASATTLLFYCSLDQVTAMLVRAAAQPSAAAVLILLLVAVAVPIIGWRLAVGRRPLPSVAETIS